jgi:hypothetical protein
VIDGFLADRSAFASAKAASYMGLNPSTWFTPSVRALVTRCSMRPRSRATGRGPISAAGESPAAILTTAQQAVLQRQRDPVGVTEVAFAAKHGLHVRGVEQPYHPRITCSGPNIVFKDLV